jgi:hypothetical protein
MTKPAAPDVLSLPISILRLSTRSANALRSLGVVTVADNARLSRGDLLRAPNLGPGSVWEIENALSRHGLALAAPSSFVVTLKSDGDADADRLLSGLRKAARRAGFILVEARAANPELKDGGR